MKPSLPLPGGELEYAVLGAIWDLGMPSAPQIYARVGEPTGRVYTTVGKVLDRLFAKGLVSRVRIGKAFSYTAKVPREVVERARAKGAVRLLLGTGGSRPAIATLVDAIEAVAPELIDELSRQVTALQRSRGGL